MILNRTVLEAKDTSRGSSVWQCGRGSTSAPEEVATRHKRQTKTFRLRISWLPSVSMGSATSVGVVVKITPEKYLDPERHFFNATTPTGGVATPPQAETRVTFRLNFRFRCNCNYEQKREGGQFCSGSWGELPTQPVRYRTQNISVHVFFTLRRTRMGVQQYHSSEQKSTIYTCQYLPSAHLQGASAISGCQ